MHQYSGSTYSFEHSRPQNLIPLSWLSREESKDSGNNLPALLNTVNAVQLEGNYEQGTCTEVGSLKVSHQGAVNL